MILTGPREHQIDGMNFLSTRKTAALGFKTGLGKSLTLLMAIDKVRKEYPKDNIYFMPVILFAPKNAADRVWPQEIAKHTKFSCKHFLNIVDELEAGKCLEEAISGIDIIIVRYSQAAKYMHLLHKLCTKRICCFDELHQLKNPQAQRTAAITYATAYCVAKWGLTATAVLNSPLDLYGVISFFNPKEFGNIYAFRRSFCIMRPQILANGREIRVVEDFKNLAALSKIRKKYILSKSQQRINVQFHRVVYSLSASEDERYNVAAAGMIGDGDRYKDFAPRLPDIQRVTDGSMNEDGSTRWVRGSKYIAYSRAISRALGRGESLILFAEYYVTLDYLEYFIAQDFPGVPLFVISGRKVRYPDKFPCIVLATAGGSESLNLKFANHVFCYSVPFSVGSFIQIVGRITRMDSKHISDLNVYLPYNDTTIDYYKTTLLEYHTSIISQLLGQDANLPKEVKDVRKSLIRQMRRDIVWRFE